MKLRKTCENGHSFYKTRDCPTCPECEKQRKPVDSFSSLLSAPARRALESVNVFTPKALATFTEKEILRLHGMGKASLPVLRKVLAGEGLAFREESKAG